MAPPKQGQSHQLVVLQLLLLALFSDLEWHILVWAIFIHILISNYNTHNTYTE